MNSVWLPYDIDQPVLKRLALNIQTNMLNGAAPTHASLLQGALGAPSQAAVLVAITEEANPKVLLTKRASHLHKHASEVSFLGGMRDAGDLCDIDTALREATEESGLSSSQVRVVGRLPVQYTLAGISVCPIVGYIPANVTLTPAACEIEQLLWAPLSHLQTTPTTEHVVNLKHPYEMVSPCWIIQNEPVWGLTGRILAALLEIGLKQKKPWRFYVRAALKQNQSNRTDP